MDITIKTSTGNYHSFKADQTKSHHSTTPYKLILYCTRFYIQLTFSNLIGIHFILFTQPPGSIHLIKIKMSIQVQTLTSIFLLTAILQCAQTTQRQRNANNF